MTWHLHYLAQTKLASLAVTCLSYHCPAFRDTSLVGLTNNSLEAGSSRKAGFWSDPMQTIVLPLPAVENKSEILKPKWNIKRIYRSLSETIAAL